MYNRRFFSCRLTIKYNVIELATYSNILYDVEIELSLVSIIL